MSNYSSPPYRQGPPQQNIRVALIHQSQKRYALYSELLSKLEAGFGQLQMEAQQAAMNLAQRNPQAHDQFQQNFGAVMRASETKKQELRQDMQSELALQDELQRWLSGQPPSQVQRAAQGGGWTQPQQNSSAPPQGWPQQQSQGQPYPQGPQPAPGGQPQGPLDLRDPKQAAAALLRAETMPLGPVGAGGPQQYAPLQQGPAYVPPGSYGSPPQGTYGAPPQAYPVPTVAPVQMQYADPSQAGPPNMPAPPPVVQYATPEAAAQAAAVVSAAALNANGVNGAGS